MAGRPTKYKKGYADQAYAACVAGGYTEEQLAEFFGVALATLVNWRKKHPEFLVAIKKGKNEHDCDAVENALLKRAKGFEFQEVHTMLDSNGKPIKEQTKIIKKESLPDTGAAAFWLKNRNPSRWSNTPARESTYTKEIIKKLDEIEII